MIHSAPFSIENGEKFALAAFNAITAPDFEKKFFRPNIWTETKNPVKLDSYWRDWVGSIRTEHFEKSNFFIFAKTNSNQPDIVDNENRNLKAQVTNFFLGLFLAGRFQYYEKPLLFTGGRDGATISIRELQEFDTPINFPGINQDEIGNDNLTTAFEIAHTVPKIWEGPNRYRRLRRIINIYFGARTEADILERLHQYARCIEGFILPSVGGTTRQFKSRTETFVGSNHHQLMGAIYEIRSAIEHLKNHHNLTSTAREDRAQIYKWAYIAEYVSRMCLVRIFTTPHLREIFESEESLGRFWEKSMAERRAIWGTPINPADAVTGFEVRNLSNSELGLSTHE